MSWADKKAVQLVDEKVDWTVEMSAGEMAACWDESSAAAMVVNLAEMLVAGSVDRKAYWKAAMTVVGAAELKVAMLVGEMAACWDESSVVAMGARWAELWAAAWVEWKVGWMAATKVFEMADKTVGILVDELVAWLAASMAYELDASTVVMMVDYLVAWRDAGLVERKGQKWARTLA